jgi:tetraacyldisaccharide 4'-kinase
VKAKSAHKAYIEDLMYGRKTSTFFGGLLGVLSVFYSVLIRIRGMLYVLHIFRRKRLVQRVISVGNITLGGTGKTPTVMQIAGVLLHHHRLPAIISRGYRRKDESAVVVVSDGQRVLVDETVGGDEPVLIGSKLRGAPVVAGSDRFRTALASHQQFGNDTVILDDGFQHIRLHRDLDIVLIDGADPFGNGRLFPAGILREPLSALRRAHAILITGADRARDLNALKNTINRWTQAPLFTSRQDPVDLVDVTTGETKQLAALRNSAVLAFSGIARPLSFTTLLRNLGVHLRSELAYGDHYRYTKSDLAEIFQQAADAKVSMIVTTEKDAVRLKGLKPEGIWALRIELKVVENEQWEALLLGKS